MGAAGRGAVLVGMGRLVRRRLERPLIDMIGRLRFRDCRKLDTESGRCSAAVLRNADPSDDHLRMTARWPRQKLYEVDICVCALRHAGSVATSLAALKASRWGKLGCGSILRWTRAECGGRPDDLMGRIVFGL